MSIRCGNCGGRHESVAAVRQCSGAPGTVAVLDRLERQGAEGAARIVSARTERGGEQRLATEKQVKYVAGLLRDREVPESVATPVQERINSGTLTARQASLFIDIARNLPLKREAAAAQTAREPLPDVPAGRYAIEMDGTLKFYIVNRPTEGRWSGWTFVAVQASDEQYPIKSYASKREILAKIAENPQEAMLRYGREIGRCGHCGRTLTDEDSRARGIGPVCAGYLGL